jgi:hypothetical protein
MSSVDVISGCHQWMSSVDVISGCHHWMSSLDVISGGHQWINFISQHWLDFGIDLPYREVLAFSNNVFNVTRFR